MNIKDDLCDLAWFNKLAWDLSMEFPWAFSDYGYKEVVEDDKH